MEKKIKQVTAYKQVEDGLRNIEYFVASDGKEFTGLSAERDCIGYEESLELDKKWNAIKHISFEITYQVPCDWYYAKNGEELEMIKRNLSFYDRVYLHVNDMSESLGESLPELKVGQWIGAYYDSNNNGKDSVYIYTLDYFNSKIEEFRKKF